MPGNGVVLDANLLVLLVVGSASEYYISKHKRLRAYTVRDFRLLANYLSMAAHIVLTPNTVTEASNLASQINEPARTHILGFFRALLQKLPEIYVNSRDAAKHGAFLRLGITDSVLLREEFAGNELLTADLDLYLAAAHAGRPVTNFNHCIEANRPAD